MEKVNEGAELESQPGLQPVPEFPKASEEEGEDTTNWKDVAQKQHDAAVQYEGVAKRNYKDLRKLQEEPKEKPKETPKEPLEPDKQEGLDYAKKAYLKASGIESQDFELVEKYVSDTGKEIDEILENKVFKQELEDRKSERESLNASPSDTPRSGVSAKDNVDYWIEKDESPPKEDVELRRKVIAERIRRDKQGGGSSKFSDNPVV